MPEASPGQPPSQLESSTPISVPAPSPAAAAPPGGTSGSQHVPPLPAGSSPAPLPDERLSQIARVVLGSRQGALGAAPLGQVLGDLRELDGAFWAPPSRSMADLVAMVRSSPLYFTVSTPAASAGRRASVPTVLLTPDGRALAGRDALLKSAALNFKEGGEARWLAVMDLDRAANLTPEAARSPLYSRKAAALLEMGPEIHLLEMGPELHLLALAVARAALGAASTEQEWSTAQHLVAKALRILHRPPEAEQAWRGAGPGPK